MKLSSTPVFQPLTITLETQEELIYLQTVLRYYADAHMTFSSEAANMLDDIAEHRFGIRNQDKQ